MTPPGLEAHARKHLAKVKSEMLKPHPNEDSIAGWDKEITAAE
jgi:hypothetical protein